MIPGRSNGGKVGEKTSEFRHTLYVSEFVSGVPRYYAYTMIHTMTGRTDMVYKVRGHNCKLQHQAAGDFRIHHGLDSLDGWST